jgi:hypothetical protein
MRRVFVRLGFALGVTTLGVAYVTSEVDAQAVDDGPCPDGLIAVASAGSDYSGGRWTLPDGTVFGISDAEDECVRPLATVDVTRYPGSDGIEVADHDARCDGVLVWAYFPGEFQCYTPAASAVTRVPDGRLPVTE